MAARFWLLGKENRPKMTLEKVKLPVFGEVKGVWFPRFGLKLDEGGSGAEVIAQVEAMTSEILGDISKREYLARQGVGDTMPHLNQVFKEMDTNTIHRLEHEPSALGDEEQVGELSFSVWRLNLSRNQREINGRSLRCANGVRGRKRSALVSLRCQWLKVTIGGRREVKEIPPSPMVTAALPR